MRSSLWIAMAIVAAVLAGYVTVASQKSRISRSHTTQGGEVHRVVYVNDGDTIKLDNGERVRMIGIDTPEAHDNQKLTRDIKRRHSDRKIQLALGEQAAQYARSLLQDQEVRLEFDVEHKDRYGRLLAYVYLPDGTFVNEQIICRGYAYPLTIPPNVRYAEKFKRCFDQSREQKRGLWR